MAKLTMNYYSDALKRNVDLTVILPIDNFDYGVGSYPEEQKYPTLYLLHGIYGDHTDWISNTRIMSYVSKYKIAVVMPSGENSFYINNPFNGAKYQNFIQEELLEVTRNGFPLSRKPYDTYLAGLSMGGFGALINGVGRSDIFGVIGGFSSAIPNELGSGDLFPGYDFGVDYKPILNETPLAFDLYQRTLDSKETMPKLYLTCGKQDFIYDKSLSYHNFLKKNNIAHEYLEWDGEHDWNFWDQSILKFLEYLNQ